jgi:flagellar basal body-associated protein FliL
MLAEVYARLMGRFAGFGHGGLRHGNLAGLHILGVLLMIAATVVLAAAATAAVSSWVAKKYRNEDSTKAAAWVTFLIVFVALGWLTLRII